jgi:hypothetical protein
MLYYTGKCRGRKGRNAIWAAQDGVLFIAVISYGEFFATNAYMWIAPIEARRIWYNKSRVKMKDETQGFEEGVRQ